MKDNIVKSNRVITILLVLAALGLLFSFSFVRAQPLTQFGNVYADDTWNEGGGVIVASQFNITQSVTVTWMSVFTQDYSPPSFIRLGIFSDNNNQPYVCLASTGQFPSNSSIGWCSFPLSNSVTLPAGTYWLAEIDSGSGIAKYYYYEGPGSSFLSVYNFSNGNFMGQLDVGNQFPTQVTSLDGTLSIIASSGQSSNPEIPTPPTFAETAKCWASTSNVNPYVVQPRFMVDYPVYIYWTPSNPSTGVVDISVFYPIGATPGHAAFCSFVDQTPESAPVQFVPDRPGTWIIDCNGYSTDVFVTSVNVFPLPEYALGTLLSLIACFAALGFFIKKKHWS
jgi:hypothetical protein